MTRIRVNGALGVISKFHTSRTNERTFIWEGGGLNPIRCAIDRKKKKKKNRSRAAELAGSNLQKKCCKSLSDLQGSGCTHANVVDQSQMSVALLKALVGTHFCSTPSRSTPPARF